jgi:queuosine biosynthesis protein QueD
MRLAFMDAAFGAEKTIPIEKMETCATCNGNGCKPGTDPQLCATCQGSGQVTRSQGFFTVRTACPTCRGKGQSIPHPCPECRGSGQTRTSKSVSVKIPAGVDSGSRLRLTGEGEAAPGGGPAGDLYVVIHVEPHDFFERHENNVVCRVPISFIQAALGDTVTVPTLDGEEEVEIPKGTQPGDLLRLKERGIPSLRNGRRGEQILQIIIKTPTNLNKKQEDLLKQFARIEAGKLTTKLKNALKGNGEWDDPAGRDPDLIRSPHQGDTPMYELKVKTHFAAAHRLTMVGEKCENLHGHNWKVEVVLCGDTLDQGGVLMDFGIIKKHLKEVIRTLDHQFLNELDFFDEATPPSSENIARYIAGELAGRMEPYPATVERVSAWESDNSCATYIPPQGG